MKKRLTLSLILGLTGAIQPAHGDGLDAHTRIMQIHEQTFEKQHQCLAKAIYFEAHDKLTSQHAVANVIVNRVLTEQYPQTVCGVINQKTTQAKTKRSVCQFSYVCEKPKKIVYSSPKWENSKVVAEAVLMTFINEDRQDLTKGATHFHDVRVKPSWSTSTKFVRTLKDSGLSFYKKKK